MSDHSWVHVQIVLNIALRLLRLLAKAGVEPAMVADHGMGGRDAEVVVAAGALLHDIGMSIHRTDHEAYSLFLAEPKLRELLEDVYEEPERTVVVSEALHAIIGHRRRGAAVHARGRRSPGRRRARHGPGPLAGAGRAGRVGIHALSAAAIDEVGIEAGEDRPVRVEIKMNNSAGDLPGRRPAGDEDPRHPAREPHRGRRDGRGRDREAAADRVPAAGGLGTRRALDAGALRRRGPRRRRSAPPRGGRSRPTRGPSSASSARPSASGSPAPSIAARRSESIVCCGKAARPSAISSARSRCASSATTSFTSPQSSASAASSTRPVRISSSARPMPDDPRQPLGAAVDQRDPEAPLGEAEPRGLGGDPQVAPQRQLEAAGQAPARDRGDRRLRRREPREAHRALGPRRPPRRATSELSSGPASAIAFRSAPAQNASGPSPVRTSTRASSSASNSRKPSSSSPAVSTSTALRRSRRSIVSTAAAPERS